MKDKNDKPGLNFEDEELLSGFVDGELDSVQMQQLCSKTSAQERSAAQQESAALRKDIKAFVRKERGLTGTTNAWSVWECIESELEPYASRWQFLGYLQRLSAVPAGVREGFEFLLRPKVAGVVFASSLVMVLASVKEREVPGRVPQQLAASIDSALLSKAKLNAFEEANSLALENREIKEDALAEDRSGKDLSSPRRSTQAAQSGVFVSFVDGSNRPSRRANRQLQSLNPQGLRVGAAQIDWIHSQTHVEIVPSAQENRAPVIWIGESVGR